MDLDLDGPASGRRLPRWLSRALFALAGIALVWWAVGVVSTGTSQRYSGTPRWFVTVDLTPRTVLGTTDVRVAFHPDTLSCRSGAPPTLDLLTAGTHIELTRQGHDADASLPPVISATDLIAAC